MEAGRVVATGTHAELVKGCPTYQRLYEAQVVDQGGAPAKKEPEAKPSNGKYKAA
jgi:hypothetical protein